MKKRGRYSRAFKVEAVRLLKQGEKPVAALAMELGVKRGLLYRWRDEVTAKGETAFSGLPGPKPTPQAGELARVKRELAAVTEERDILKKAAAYFARDLR